MTTWTDRAQWRAIGVAALLFVSGGVMGVMVDRLWLAPPEAHAAPLTARAMAARLGLSVAEEERLVALLDSLHADILHHSPDSLGTAVRNAQLRIEAALPAAARSEFRAWLQEHHEQLTGRMRGGSRDHGMTHR